jgi:hypothetical protein
MPGQDNNPATTRQRSTTPHRGHPRLFPQNLNRVFALSPDQHHRRTVPTTPHKKMAVLDAPAGTRSELASVSDHEHPGPTSADRGPLDQEPYIPGQPLLRKEVIQPHLPVRLPCYDFVPIASPTFDGSPPHGLGHRLRVLPTFVT